MLETLDRRPACPQVMAAATEATGGLLFLLPGPAFYALI